MKFQDTYSCICSHDICANACALAFCYTSARDVFIAKMTYRARVHVYRCVYVAPGLSRNGSVVYTFTHKLMNVTTSTRKNFPNSYSSTAGHQENSTPHSFESLKVYYSCTFLYFIYKIQGFKYGGWGWTSRALPIRTCTSHNSLVTSTET